MLFKKQRGYPSLGAIVMLLMVFLSISEQVFSQQQKTITGIVMEGDLPLPGVTIRVKGGDSNI